MFPQRSVYIKNVKLESLLYQPHGHHFERKLISGQTIDFTAIDYYSIYEHTSTVWYMTSTNRQVHYTAINIFQNFK